LSAIFSASGFVAGAAIRYDLNLNPQATASMGQSVGATTLGASNSVWVVTLAQLKQLDASFNAGSNFKALPAATAAIQPTAIAVDSQNRIWVADQANGGIWRFTNLNPDFFVTIPVSTDSGQVNPAGLAVSTDSIWVSSRGDVHLYQRKLVDGSDAGSFILPAPARGPVVMAPNNLLWVSHEFRNGTNALAKFSLTGQLLRDYDVNQDVPVALAADSRGFVWAALRGISRVSRLTPADGSLLSYGSQWIVRPMAIAVDASGDAFVASPGASGSLARIPAAP